VPWFASINSIASVGAAPLLLWLWRRQAARGREPGDLGKMAIGAWITALSNLVLVVAIVLSRGAPVSVLWGVAYSGGLGAGFMYYWPTLLALYRARRRRASTRPWSA
jgi:POT family proton-dependent oligopeptide transporter